MGFRERRQDMATGKGRILQMRLGINPNSSGHGVMLSMLFFLPFSVVLILVSQVEKSLYKALEDYSGKTQQLRAAPELLPIWLLSWGGFAFLWTVVLVSLLAPGWQWTGMTAPLIAAAGAVMFIAVLVYRCRYYPGLRELSRRAAYYAVYGAVLVALYIFTTDLWNFDPLHAALAVSLVYLSLSALLLALGVLKLSGLLQRSMLLAAFIYIGVGFLTIMPVIPVPADSLNPVGLFFILWGPGAPFVAAVAGLRQMGSVSLENPENPL